MTGLRRLCLCLALYGSWGQADEIDNFTDRRPLKDETARLNQHLNELIEKAVQKTNQQQTLRKAGPCAPDLLEKFLVKTVNATQWGNGTFGTALPHSTFEGWLLHRSGIPTRKIPFKNSIYGERSFDQIITWPINHKMMNLASLVSVNHTLIGVDKLSHFIREGLITYRLARKESSRLGHPLNDEEWNAFVAKTSRHWENGLQGRWLTGVFSYGDIAANVTGSHFWRSLLDFKRPDALITCHQETGLFQVRAKVDLADYVSPAWDEAINCSEFSPQVAPAFLKRLTQKGLKCPIEESACDRLRLLKGAQHFVNPKCLNRSEDFESSQAQHK